MHMIHRCLLSALATTQLCSSIALASDFVTLTDVGTKTSIQKHLIKNAISVQITPRGQKPFDTNLSQVLGNLGANVDEGYFPTQSFSVSKPIRIEDYTDRNAEAVKIFKQVRELFTKWFVGLSINDPRPKVEIGESGYTAQFSRFGLVTDSSLMSKLGKRDGAILAIELEIKKLNIGTRGIQVWDLENEFLGKAGLEDVNLQAGSDGNPIKMRLPFYIRVNSEGKLVFEALEVTQNLDSVNIDIDYKKLVIPQLAVLINGKQYNLNNQEIEKLISDNMPELLITLRKYIGNFAKKDLPALLNKKMAEALSGSLEETQEMKPPGAPEGDRRPNFKWGFVLSSINLQKSLNINLHAYAEDTLNPNSGLTTTDGARGVAEMNGMSDSDYDIGMALDRGLINRILKLSYQRKNFEKIKMSDGSSMKLMASPWIDYIKTPSWGKVYPNETFIKLHVSVENKPDTVWLKNTITLDFDIIAVLRNPKGKEGMQIFLKAIDLESLWMDPSFTTPLGRLFPGKIRKGIQEKLYEISKPWAAKEQPIEGNLPMPPEILGMKLDLQKVSMDSTGNLVMYLNYNKDSVRKNSLKAALAEAGK